MFPRPLSVAKNIMDLEGQQWLDRDGIERLQARKLERVAQAASNTPFYGKIMEGCGLTPSDMFENLQALPMTWKRDIQADPDALIRRGIDMASLTVSQTSGSSGNPLLLRMDQEALDFRVGLKYAVEMGMGLTPFDLFAEIAHRPYERPLIVRLSRLFRRQTMSVFDDEKANYAKLKASRPDFLGWYPSTIGILAKLNSQSGDPLRLKAVFSGSETLTHPARRAIAESFSCDVFNTYAATELSTIAFECPQEHSMHVCSPSCILEIVDSRGKPKRSGTGELVLTNLHNRAMPLLRYRIGDRGSWGKDCACGRGLPVLRTMEGRSNDLIVLPSGRIRSPITMDIMYDVPGLLEYQIVQEREDLFVFRYVPSGEDLEDASKEEIIRRMRVGTLHEDVRIELEHSGRLRRGSTGKLSTIVSKVRGGPHA